MQQSLQQFANGVAQSLAVTHEVAKIVGPALLNFAKKAQEISVAVKPVLEAFQQWMVSFSEAILQWQIPTISEERKQELILSHKKWGEYGWTLPPSAPIKFFYDCVNLFSCIETGFAPAENFKAEPYTFNRNYLAHGMTRRPVRQRDCIQLFFALYNLTVFLKFS